MKDAKSAILNFAQSLETPKRRTKVRILPPSPHELRVSISRMGDLISIKEAQQKKLLKGTMAFLNRKAASRELKSVKLPGSKEWHVLPEWIEDFNNRWLFLNHGR